MMHQYTTDKIIQVVRQLEVRVRVLPEICRHRTPPQFLVFNLGERSEKKRSSQLNIYTLLVIHIF